MPGRVYIIFVQVARAQCLPKQSIRSSTHFLMCWDLPGSVNLSITLVGVVVGWWILGGNTRECLSQFVWVIIAFDVTIDEVAYSIQFVCA